MLPEALEEPLEEPGLPHYIEELESGPGEETLAVPIVQEEPLKPDQRIPGIEGEVLDFSEADAFVLAGQYYKALERYRAMLQEYPDNKKVLQRMAELKNLLKLLGKDQEIIVKLEALLEGIRRRRDEFFSSS